MHEPIIDTPDFTVWLFDQSHHDWRSYSRTGKCGWGGFPHKWCYSNGDAFFSVEGIYGSVDKRASFAVCRGHLGVYIQNVLAIRSAAA